MTPDGFRDWCDRRALAVRAHAPAEFAQAHLADVAHQAPLAEWVGRVLDGKAPALLLDGPVGTGKTHAAYACWFDLIERGWVGAWRSSTEARYLESLRIGGDRMHAASCETADVLHLDDLAATPPSDWTRGQMFALIDARWSQNLPTVVTTNLTGRALAEHLGERAASRLAHGCVAVTLTGPDRRRS